jgi:DNA-directed RNA polymerase specialized sigma subunit
MEENYYALVLAILTGCTPEEAFEWLDKGYKHRTRQRSKDISIEVLRLRYKGLTNKEIGEILGLSEHAVSKRYNRAKKVIHEESMI